MQQQIMFLLIHHLELLDLEAIESYTAQLLQKVSFKHGMIDWWKVKEQ